MMLDIGLAQLLTSRGPETRNEMSQEQTLPSFFFDTETNRAIHDALPEIVLDILALVTRLGDGAVLVAIAVLFYWFGAETDWRKRGMLMAIAVATLSLNAGLKGIFEIPRPFVADPTLLEEFAVESPGFSTPSAHAMGAAAVYGGLAAVMDTGKRWQRYLIAAFLIGTIALSRVTLGVHYLGDVILGVVLGLLLIAGALYAVDDSTESVLPMFAFALGVALVSRPLGSEEFVTMSIGASAGGLIAWKFIHNRDPKPLGASILAFGAVLIPALLAFRVVEALVTVDIFVAVAGFELPVMAGFRATGYAVLFGLALAVPAIAEQLNENARVRQLQTALPFRGRTLDPELFDHHLTERDD